MFQFNVSGANSDNYFYINLYDEAVKDGYELTQKPIFAITSQQTGKQKLFYPNVMQTGDHKERFYRFSTLGYSVGRIDNVVYHLEHARGENSWVTNPHMESNMGEWNKIQQMNKEQLLQYYSEQKYLEKYVSD